ncbi:MAG: tetratricopeptide repeat protein [Gemmatimonadaceae bacterium]
MKTPLVQPAAPPPAASVSDFVVTFAVVLAAVLGLLLFDTALAKVDIRERRAYAAREFQTGSGLLAQGKIPQAIEHLRSASTLDNDNSNYATALAQAILADGRPSVAEQMLLPLLERNPTDGAASLAMARVLDKEGRAGEAKSYYHRAIYGSWPAGAERTRTAARFELIDFLARTNSKQELLAELLPIQDDSTNDVAQRKKIAQLFVVAGSPARAVTIFRDLLRHDERDPDAYLGLAEAALVTGDFTTAKADLLAAQRLMPADSIFFAARIARVDSVVGLDPTQPGLSLAEQFRRSKNLVQMTLTSLRSCLGTRDPQVAAALDSAAMLLVPSASGEGQAQSIQQNLSLAAQLWGLGRTRCAPDRGDGAVALIQNRIAQ